MIAKRLIVLLAAMVLGFSAAPANAQSHSRQQIEVLAQFYAQYYDVPLALVRRVINRESTFNPSARNGPYYGLMQILPATARTMGFRGQPSDLLNAETNLIYAVKYLRGAWLLAGGSHDRAVQLYASGYYYDAKAAGLLEETGLRAGPANPVAPTPPTAVVAAAEPVPPAPVAEVVEVAAIEPVETVTEVAAAPAIAPLGFLPPSRPESLVAVAAAPAQTEALEAIAVAEAEPLRPRSIPDRPQVDTPPVMLAYADSAGSSAARRTDVATQLRPSVDLISGTFDLLETLGTASN